VLLVFIGGNMIREALGKEEEEVDDSFAFRTMLTLAIATSIDALAVGVTLRLQGADILLAAPMIAVTTGVLSPIGLKVGNVFGARYKSKAELAGGVVLVALGIKFLLEGLGVL
jgi:putative Mn2+ efflux pump MntP